MQYIHQVFHVRRNYSLYFPSNFFISRGGGIVTYIALSMQSSLEEWDECSFLNDVILLYKLVKIFSLAWTQKQTPDFDQYFL
jgi:hypothetical protein